MTYTTDFARKNFRQLLDEALLGKPVFIKRHDRVYELILIEKKKKEVKNV